MFRCNECSFNYETKIALSNHLRIHKKNDVNLRNNIINDYVNNYLTYIELRIKYNLSNNSISKFVKGVEVDKKEKTKIRNIHFNHSDETKKLLSDKRKNWLKNNPDKHVWKRNDKFKSKPCEYFKSILLSNNINFVDEYSPLKNKSYSVDIAFPSVKIGIEINGNQHYNNDYTLKSYYLNRKNEIQNSGWKLYDIHYSKVYNKDFVNNFLLLLSENKLNDLDLSFYIKDKKINKNRQQKYKEKIKPIILEVENSNIDFSKNGWVKKVSEIVGIHENKGGWWMKKNMNDFYETKCKKRIVKYTNKSQYYENPKYCLNCGNVILFDKRDQKFCKRGCSSSYNNKTRK